MSNNSELIPALNDLKDLMDEMLSDIPDMDYKEVEKVTKAIDRIINHIETYDEEQEKKLDRRLKEIFAKIKK